MSANERADSLSKMSRHQMCFVIQQEFFDLLKFSKNKYSSTFWTLLNVFLHPFMAQTKFVIPITTRHTNNIPSVLL